MYLETRSRLLLFVTELLHQEQFQRKWFYYFTQTETKYHCIHFEAVLTNINGTRIYPTKYYESSYRGSTSALNLLHYYIRVVGAEASV
jgi:hypothetical protein